MGNGISQCFTAPGRPPHHRRHRLHPSSTAAVSSVPLDDGLGHSFFYLSSSSVSTSTSTSTSTFPLSLSGASVSANTSTPLSTSLSDDPLSSFTQHPAAFDSSNRFSSLPLQPAPISGPLCSSSDRSGFLSGPIERSLFSAPLSSAPKPTSSSSSSYPLKRSFSQSRNLIRGFFQTIRRTVGVHGPKFHPKPVARNEIPADDDVSSLDGDRLQWAQGKAGEDRVHVVVSEEHGWAFVGIYDGFNGPDATDFLLTSLYLAVEKELKGLVWERSDEVLKALAVALRKTEDTFFDCADMMASENPELALMGSCVLVMLMKGEDVYLMNVGDSRAVLAQMGKKDLERISEESLGDDELLNLGALQLTLDHSTSVEEEVVRIRSEHPEDNMAIANARVKGSLKVTRAFGAGFLKQPKWNDALLEMFRIDYIGNSPYITCNPSLYHHRVGVRDRFLILSSDGLYQYFTNEEVVAEVELFIATTPEGDPAQHLIEEMLFRAAKKAGMDFHELLEIPQGDRRRYHDDVSIIVISLEGRIWRSSV